MKKNKAALRDATFRQLCRLRYDHYQRDGFAISTDTESVYLSQQLPGQEITQEFECSRRMFNRLIAEYQKPKKFIR